MRWLVMIFALNVLLGLWHWADLRKVKPISRYEVDLGVEELALPQAGNSCLLLGPLKKSEDAELLRRRLIQEGYVVELTEKEFEKAPRYWVYYGPMEDYAAALEQHQLFRENGIDSFIITKERLYGALSLGVFENIDSAQRMQAYMGSKGYQASIRNIFKFESDFWVEIRRPSEEIKVIKIKEIGGSLGLQIELREFLCKTVASEKPFP